MLKSLKPNEPTTENPLPATTSTGSMVASPESGQVAGKDVGWEISSILVVDDVGINRKFAKKWLEGAFPHAVIDLAENGQIAVNNCEKRRYDVIVMDINMPVKGGYDATEAIRAHEVANKMTKSIIIGFSSYEEVDENEYDSKSRAAGMDCLLLKAVGGSKEALIETINDRWKSRSCPSDFEEKTGDPTTLADNHAGTKRPRSS
jgi:osomolarity two-component system sensor histidine kinase NIK1